MYQRFDEIGNADLNRTYRSTPPDLDGRLAENELVIGVAAGDEAWAFPLRAVARAAPMQAEVGGIPIVILEDGRGMPSLAYHRALTDGTVLEFVRNVDGLVVDLPTGSLWAANGLATSGDLAGLRLTFVTSFLTEWYGWAAFHPDTHVFEGAR